MRRINICEIHLKNEQVLYLAINGRESFKEALNQIVFFNLSILIFCKITYSGAHIWHGSGFLVCCYAKYKLYCNEFSERIKKIKVGFSPSKKEFVLFA